MAKNRNQNSEDDAFTDNLIAAIRVRGLMFGNDIILPDVSGSELNDEVENNDMVFDDAGATCGELDDGGDFSRGSAADSARRRLAELESLALTCTACRLSEQRTKVVFGAGNPNADLVFCGEGPGRDEDLSGLPFVGRAGKKLTEMILAMGFTREDVYILNTVKCRPPNNRTPQVDEIAACNHFLTDQIAIIQPKVIVALGAPAAKTLLKTTESIGRLRGRFHEYEGIPVMPTYHPSYILRSYTRENREKVWFDLQQVVKFLKESS